MVWNNGFSFYFILWNLFYKIYQLYNIMNVLKINCNFKMCYFMSFLVKNYFVV